MQKIIIALSIVQTLVVVFLTARIIELDGRLAHTEQAMSAGFRAAASYSAAPSGAPVSAPAIAPGDAGNGATTLADAATLRAILREELAAMRLAGGAGNATTEQSPVEAPADPQAKLYAGREFNRLLAKGSVETRDLDNYLDKIAALPAAERKQALQALTKAMNDGRINGRF